MDASITLYTFKEGLLSKLAHDLRLSVTQFEIRALGAEVSASFDPRSIRVDGVMKNGELLGDEPSEGDRRKILQNLLDDVLRVKEFGEIKLLGQTASAQAPFALHGQLTLCGVTRPLATQLVRQAGRLSSELELTPSSWGIKPFRALGGTLKVQDRVRVAISAEWPDAEQPVRDGVELRWSSGQGQAAGRRQ